MVYAKCGPHPSFPDAVLAENVGREGHTFLKHMRSLLENGTAAAAVDVVLFVNGGSGARGESVQQLFNLVHMVSQAARRDDSRVWFADPGQLLTTPVNVTGPRPCRHRHGLHFPVPALNGSVAASAAAFVARARAECQWVKGGCCKLCRVSSCCLQFGPDNICPPHEQRVADDAVSCEYIGKTAENYVGVYPMALMPARPPNFVSWLAAQGVDFGAWEAVGWFPQGSFAVSMDAVRRLGMEPIHRGVVALEAAGRGGGMTGMFYERIWRALFALTTCDSLEQGG